MSASNDHQSSGEEESEMLSMPGMPDLLPRGPRSDDVRNISRQSPWTTAHLGRPPGYTSQRSSPGGSDLGPSLSPFEGRGLVPRTFGVPDAYLPPLPSFALPPSTTELSPAFASDFRRRSATDQLSVFGRRSQESPGWDSEALNTTISGQDEHERNTHLQDIPSTQARYTSRGSRPPYPRDEFDGPAQLLPLPLPEQEQSRTRTLPDLPVNLFPHEQEEIARATNDILSQCAFHFVAKYQFPIPLERDKRTVRQASDREWTEWAYLLKRLATKRRIPARVLYDSQIKQLVTTLENSIAVRQSINARNEPSTPRQPRDDRYLLQLISSGLQVAKILKDSLAMEHLDQLYVQTEALVRSRISSVQGSVGTGRGQRGVLDPGPIGRPAGGSGGGIGGSGGGNPTGY